MLVLPILVHLGFPVEPRGAWWAMMWCGFVAVTDYSRSYLELFVVVASVTLHVRVVDAKSATGL